MEDLNDHRDDLAKDLTRWFKGVAMAMGHASPADDPDREALMADVNCIADKASDDLNLLAYRLLEELNMHKDAVTWALDAHTHPET